MAAYTDARVAGLSTVSYLEVLACRIASKIGKMSFIMPKLPPPEKGRRFGRGW